MFIFLLHLNRSFFASSSYLLQCILYINCLHSGSMLVHIFASMRAAYNQNPIDPTFQLCNQAEETVSHFLICCKTLEYLRTPTVNYWVFVWKVKLIYSKTIYMYHIRNTVCLGDVHTHKRLSTTQKCSSFSWIIA
jgi:hypothetical protein